MLVQIDESSHGSMGYILQGTINYGKMGDWLVDWLVNGEIISLLKIIIHGLSCFACLPIKVLHDINEIFAGVVQSLLKAFATLGQVCCYA